MIINYKIYLEKLYILILGVITSFSLPPYNYWFLNFLTFSLLFIFLLKHKYKNIKSFIIFGYLFGFGFFVSNIYWIPFSLTYEFICKAKLLSKEKYSAILLPMSK